MLPKRQKLNRGKSASADVNSNRSIISMFARQPSHNQFQNVQTDKQHTTSQTVNLSKLADRPQVANRLSLSARKKRSHITDSVITISDDDGNNNTVDIYEPSCTVFHSTDKVPDATDDLPSEASVISAESFPDIVSPVSSNHQCGSDFTSTREEDLISDENSVSDLLPARQSTVDTDVARVPYYLENFRLVLDSVFQDTFYADLFNNDDLSALHTFQSLNGKLIMP